jgi:hypothetical protein
MSLLLPMTIHVKKQERSAMPFGPSKSSSASSSSSAPSSLYVSSNINRNAFSLKRSSIKLFVIAVVLNIHINRLFILGTTASIMRWEQQQQTADGTAINNITSTSPQAKDFPPLLLSQPATVEGNISHFIASTGHPSSSSYHHPSVAAAIETATQDTLDQSNDLPILPQPYITVGGFWNHSLNETTRRTDHRNSSPQSYSSAWPYIGTDVWYESVDNNRTFFGRRWFDYSPTDRHRIMGDSNDHHNNHHPHHSKTWIEWLDQLQWPVTIVISANKDTSWPSLGVGRKEENIFGGLNVSILDHPMLAKLFIMNPSIYHPKVSPLPIGLKWNYRSRTLYSESKRRWKSILHSTLGGAGPNTTKALFQSTTTPHRTDTVWVRPGRYNDFVQYDTTANPALSTKRIDLCRVLSRSAPESLRCHHSIGSVQEMNSATNQSTVNVPINSNSNNNSVLVWSDGPVMSNKTIPINMYYEQLKQHRFVASPPGNGLDTHGTWEALVAGCIPIVPHSPLDPMFEHLPVWLIDSWDEVTDISISLKAKEMVRRVNEYHWDKVYVSGWIKAMDDAAIKAGAKVLYPSSITKSSSTPSYTLVG